MTINEAKLINETIDKALNHALYLKETLDRSQSDYTSKNVISRMHVANAKLLLFMEGMVPYFNEKLPSDEYHEVFQVLNEARLSIYNNQLYVHEQQLETFQKVIEMLNTMIMNI